MKLLITTSIGRLQKRSDVKVKGFRIYIHKKHQIGLKGWRYIDHLRKFGFNVYLVKSFNDIL